MTNILPEPSDAMLTYSPDEVQPTNPLNRQTLTIMVGLIIIALLALLAGFIYDYSHNHNQDNTRKQDLVYVSNFINGYYNLNHYYPTLKQINSSSFGAFAPNLNKSKFKDPSSNIETLSATPASNSYAYEVSPPNCNNSSQACTGYKLVAVLSDDKDYIVASPVH